MPRKPIDYSKTIIYKLCCNDPTITDIYVGHTTDFKARKAQHKTRCNNLNDKKHNIYVYQFIRKHNGFDNWSMIEIEKICCIDELEACKNERKYIELLGATLNKQIPTRTNKEYYELNKEVISEKKKQYRELNKDNIKEKKKEYYELNKDSIKEKKKEYYELNNDSIKEQNKQYRELNKDTIKEKNKEWYELNKEVISDKKKQYRELNKDNIKEQKKEYYQLNKEEINKKRREKRIQQQESKTENI